jgi:hypothetical protein
MPSILKLIPLYVAFEKGEIDHDVITIELILTLINAVIFF